MSPVSSCATSAVTSARLTANSEMWTTRRSSGALGFGMRARCSAGDSEGATGKGSAAEWDGGGMSIRIGDHAPCRYGGALVFVWKRIISPYDMLSDTEP